MGELLTDLCGDCGAPVSMCGGRHKATPERDISERLAALEAERRELKAALRARSGEHQSPTEEME
jgi:hypothetical protein